MLSPIIRIKQGQLKIHYTEFQLIALYLSAISLIDFNPFLRSHYEWTGTFDRKQITIILKQVTMKKNLFILIIAIMASTCTMFVVSANEPTKISWTGGNGDWNDITNWDESRLPTDKDHVIIPQGYVHIGASTTIRTLSINLLGDAHLFVGEGARIELVGNNSLYSSLNLIENTLVENFGQIHILQSISTGMTIMGGRFENYGHLAIWNSPIDGIMTRAGGAFVNHVKGQVEIGGLSTVAIHLRQNGNWNNEGSVQISEGILMDGILIRDEAQFRNTGKINFTASIGDNAIDNRSAFENCGEIIILSTCRDAIRNSKTLRNTGVIKIALAGGNAISGLTQESLFVNGGKVQVKQARFNGIHLIDGSLFRHEPEAELVLDNCKIKGVEHKQGKFINHSSYSISKKPLLPNEKSQMPVVTKPLLKTSL